ncbi:MAG: ABC transporter ATP-binding protein [Gammaproteobacteria bacterium]|nr:ABC transporter ATP-binding protein [Gammaproteobacteria bacterium]
MALLEVRGLSKAFGGVTAISNLSFRVDSGVVYAVIGPNGAGKTTLFNMLSGIYQADSGEIHFKQQRITALAPYQIAKAGISRTFQNLQIFFNMSVHENVLVGCHLRTASGVVEAMLRLSRVRKEERQVHYWADESLEFCGLSAYRNEAADALPYGVLKRLEIARALAVEPQLLMMDEPAAGLNDTESVEMIHLIRRIRDRGTTVLLVEHNMDLIMNVSDRLLVLDYGSRLAEGSCEEIQQNPKVIAAYLGGEVRTGV